MDLGARCTTSEYIASERLDFNIFVSGALRSQIGSYARWCTTYSTRATDRGRPGGYNKYTGPIALAPTFGRPFGRWAPSNSHSAGYPRQVRLLWVCVCVCARSRRGRVTWWFVAAALCEDELRFVSDDEPPVELTPGGAAVIVSEANLREYVCALSEHLL